MKKPSIPEQKVVVEKKDSIKVLEQFSLFSFFFKDFFKRLHPIGKSPFEY